MDKRIARLLEVMERRERFMFDLRSNCRMYSGIISAYRATPENDHFTELPAVIAHALDHDGIIDGWRDPVDGKTYYKSCRAFTDLDHALRFAREEHQRSVYNLNRGIEIPVSDPPRRRDGGEHQGTTHANIAR